MEAKHKPEIDRPHPTGMGTQKIYRFENGFGASVVRTPYTYGGNHGLWELAVVKFDGHDHDDFALTYDTPITNDVEGHLTEAEVDSLLDKIADLPKAGA